jgi:hypothetical protein
MLTIGFEPETFVAPNSESTFESSTCKWMGLSKVGIHPLQKSRYGLIDDGQQFNSIFCTITDMGLSEKTKPLLNIFL